LQAGAIELVGRLAHLCAQLMRSGRSGDDVSAPQRHQQKKAKIAVE
jgi:hypothetical protein